MSKFWLIVMVVLWIASIPLILVLHHFNINLIAYAYAILLFVVVVRFALSILLPSQSRPVTWRIAVAMVILLFGLPAALIELATGGGSANAISIFFLSEPRNDASRFYGVLSEVLLVLISALLIYIPGFLNLKGRATGDNSSAPSWLAGFAGILTVAFILTLHYGETPPSGLTKIPVGVLAITALGAASLLAPIYQAIVTRCIKQGIVAVFDPACWLTSLRTTYNEMMGN